MVKLADPVASSIPAHNAVPPSRIDTNPVGVFAAGPAATVTVNVTLCPLTAGFALEASIVVVATDVGAA